MLRQGDRLHPVFGIPITLVSLMVGLMVMTDCMWWSDMKTWEEMPAKVTAGGFDHRDDGAKYAFVEYEYVVDGQTYHGDRLSIHMRMGGESLGNYFREAELNDERIPIFVDPENPSESIYDRDIRWGWIAWRSFWCLMIGFVGINVLRGNTKVQE